MKYTSDYQIFPGFYEPPGPLPPLKKNQYQGAIRGIPEDNSKAYILVAQKNLIININNISFIFQLSKLQNPSRPEDISVRGNDRTL